MRKPKFKEGDKVIIVKYGSIAWFKKDMLWDSIKILKITKEANPTYIVDLHPEYIGEIGIVTKVDVVQNTIQYALEGPNKVAWYNENQLEKYGWWQQFKKWLNQNDEL